MARAKTTAKIVPFAQEDNRLFFGAEKRKSPREKAKIRKGGGTNKKLMKTKCAIVYTRNRAMSPERVTIEEKGRQRSCEVPRRKEKRTHHLDRSAEPNDCAFTGGSTRRGKLGTTRTPGGGRRPNWRGETKVTTRNETAFQSRPLTSPRIRTPTAE